MMLELLLASLKYRRRRVMGACKTVGHNILFPGEAWHDGSAVQVVSWVFHRCSYTNGARNARTTRNFGRSARSRIAGPLMEARWTMAVVTATGASD
jgi:hypothetical protein